MRKRLILFFAFTLLLANMAVAADDPLTIKVGVYDNAPKIYVEGGEAKGFWADIVNYIAEEEDWEIEYVKGTWTEGLDRLESGEIDLMVDVAVTETRKEKYEFTDETVLVAWSEVYILKDSGLESFFDLEGKNIGVLKDSVNYLGSRGIKELLDNFDIDVNFVEFDSYDEVFEGVKNGEADVGATNNFYGRANSKKYGLKISPLVFQPSDINFALPKGAAMNEGLIKRIDYHVSRLKDDQGSVYHESIKHLMGVTEGVEIIPEEVALALIILGILALLLVVFNVVLQRQVEVKTRELQKSRDTLEIKVKERTEELRGANERLKGLDRLKSMFIASMSHELRTPLNSIIGFTGIMLQGMSGKITTVQRKQLLVVKSSSHHLLALINDIIDVSKIEAGEMDISIDEFNLPSVMSEVKDSLSVAATKKKLKLSLKAPKTLVVKSDERRAKQVITNLVNNAIKFTDKGGIEMAAAKKGSNVVITVKDTGIGIKKEHVKQLFEAFSQIYAEGQPKQEGTGLGLYLSKKLATALGGKLSAKSTWGKGSEFTFTMPLKHRKVKK